MIRTEDGQDDLQFLEDACNDIESEKGIEKLRQTSRVELCPALTRDILFLYYSNLIGRDDSLLPEYRQKIERHLEGCYTCNEHYRDIKDDMNEVKKKFKPLPSSPELSKEIQDSLREQDVDIHLEGDYT